MQKITILVSILTLALTSVLWTAEANAGRRDDRGHNTHNQQPTHFNAHRRGDRDRGGYHRGRGNRDHGSYRHHNRPRYAPYVSHYGVQVGYRPRAGHRRHHNAGGGVILGLGLGMIANELIHSSRHHHHNHHVSPPRVIHSDAVVRPYRNTQPAQQAGGFDEGSCLQTREYQTVVVIGGKEVDAYGTACLQPDGSWMQGPAIVEPEF